jgi:hypothetical protein
MDNYCQWLQKWQQGQSPVGLLGYKVTNPGDYAARAKTSSLAAFAVIVLLDLRSSPTVLSISLLIALSKPNSGPS